MSFTLLLAAGITGLILHWFKRYARKEITENFITYMKAEKWNSIAAVGSVFGAIVTLYATGDVALSKQTLALAFMSGYTLDSVVNKSGDDT